LSFKKDSKGNAIISKERLLLNAYVHCGEMIKFFYELNDQRWVTLHEIQPLIVHLYYAVEEIFPNLTVTATTTEESWKSKKPFAVLDKVNIAPSDIQIEEEFYRRVTVAYDPEGLKKDVEKLARPSKLPDEIILRFPNNID
jgi:hypothetical protein